MAQEEYVFDESPKKGKGGVGKFIWNSDTREFCGRDGASWAKVSLFYAIFYACLGSFFVGMLAVFVSFMPRDVPTYYGEKSTMNARKINPGLGFRPQVDVEDSLIIYNPLVKENPYDGYLKYTRNLKHFLDAKYGKVQESNDVIKCVSNHTYNDDLKNGKSCEFDQVKLFKETDCNDEHQFGFKTQSPCILIKLNKIISWTPAGDQNGVRIKCDGETSADKDNLRKVIYHSENNIKSSDSGFIDAKFFPYFNQKAYRAPFIWIQPVIPANTLVNIECKAYAANIDNDDRLNRRGQTKFSLMVISETD